MIVPVEADILTPLLIRRRLGITTFVAALIFAAVCVPFFLGLRRKRREPLVWGGRPLLIATAVILSLNVLWFGSVLIYNLFR
jgi:hypothetical protein